MEILFQDFLRQLPIGEKTIIEQGTANTVYRYGASFLVREKKLDEVDSPFQNAGTEKEAYTLIGACPIVPELLYLDSRGNKVERFVEGRIFDPSNIEDLSKVAKTLQRLHALPLGRGATKFLPMARYLHYKRVCKEELDKEKEDEIILAAFPYLDSGKMCLCHNDLWAGNIIVSDERAYLLDLEFASASPYYFDLASLIEENSLSKEQTESFLAAYDPEYKEHKLPQKINALVLFHHVLWFYWAKARYEETKNPVFLEIADAKRSAFLSFPKEEA